MSTNGLQNMADSASELESDASSVDGGPTVKPLRPQNMDQLKSRIEFLEQENRVLRMELESVKLKCKQLQEENRELRKASVNIQARAEQEEEYISNTLLKKINALKKEKEKLAMNYEQEEEFLTNDLSRKLCQLRQEKMDLEQNLAREQENQVSKLMRRIEKLENETTQKQQTLEQLRREKVELENCLEQEQEALVNKLWKKMEKLESEKRLLQEKLEQPISAPPSPQNPDAMQQSDGDLAVSLSNSIQSLKHEVGRLRNQLNQAQHEHKEKMAQYEKEEKHIREQNLRLQRKLQMEIERREQLCRHLSESESSLEMDDERIYNEMAKAQDKLGSSTQSATFMGNRPRTVSSPVNIHSPNSSRPLSPSSAGFSSGTFSPTGSYGRVPGGYMANALHSTSPPSFTHMPAHQMTHIPHGAGSHAHHVPTSVIATKGRVVTAERFVKPTAVPPASTGGFPSHERMQASSSQSANPSVSQSSSQSSLQGDRSMRAPQSPMQVEKPIPSPVDKRSQSPMQTDK